MPTQWTLRALTGTVMYNRRFDPGNVSEFFAWTSESTSSGRRQRITRRREEQKRWHYCRAGDAYLWITTNERNSFIGRVVWHSAPYIAQTPRFRRTFRSSCSARRIRCFPRALITRMHRWRTENKRHARRERLGLYCSTWAYRSGYET